MEEISAKLAPLYQKKVHSILSAALDEPVYLVTQVDMGVFSVSEIEETEKKIRDVTTLAFEGKLSDQKGGVINMTTGGKSADGQYETYANVLEYELVEIWESVMANYKTPTGDFDDQEFISIYAQAVEYGIAPHVAPYQMEQIYLLDLV